MSMEKFSGMSEAQRTILEDKTLERAQYELHLTRWAKRRLFAEREGYRITFARFANLSAKTTALTEGETPAGESLTPTTVTIEPDFYGAYIYLTKKMVKKGIFDLVNDDVPNMFGYQAALTADTLMRANLGSNATAQIADGQSLRTDLTASNILDAEELYIAATTLRANGARPFPEAGNNYILVAHPHQTFDLKRDAEYISAMQNARERGPENPLFGLPMADFAGFRIFESQNIEIESDGGSGTVDAYIAFAIAQDSYGMAGLGGMLPSHEEAGTGTKLRPIDIWTDDFTAYPPMHTHMSIAWMIDQGQNVLNSSWILRLETASSRGTN